MNEDAQTKNISLCFAVKSDIFTAINELLYAMIHRISDISVLLPKILIN